MQGSSIMAEHLHFLGCNTTRVSHCKSLAKVLPSTGSPDRTRSHQCMDEQLLSHSWGPRQWHSETSRVADVSWKSKLPRETESKLLFFLENFLFMKLCYVYTNNRKKQDKGGALQSQIHKQPIQPGGWREVTRKKIKIGPFSPRTMGIGHEMLSGEMTCSKKYEKQTTKNGTCWWALPIPLDRPTKRRTTALQGIKWTLPSGKLT